MKRELQKKVRYELSGTCAVCGGAKSKFLNAAEVRMLPPEALDAPEGTTFDNAVERDGGLLPLLPLLGAIAAGVSALAGAGGAAASAVLGAQKNAEDERHNREIEKIAQEASAAKAGDGEKAREGGGAPSQSGTRSALLPPLQLPLGLSSEEITAIDLLRSKGYAVTAPDDMLPATIGYLQGKGFVVSI